MIAGVGPALVDRICLVDEFPKRGGQAVVKRTEKSPGGAAANVIYGLAKFGVKSSFYTTIGRDEDGELFRKSMEEVGVVCKFLEVEGETGKVDVYVDKRGERTFFVFPNAAGKFHPFLTDDDYRVIDYFYLDPFPFEGSLDAHIAIAKRAKEFRKRVILNPGYPYSRMGLKKLEPLLKNTDIVFLSRDEYEMLGGIENHVGLLVVTLGEKGSMALKDGREFFSEAFKVGVVDTTGAGDAFAAGFLYAYLNGHPIELCLRVGNFVASYNIQRLGARNFPPKELVDEFIRKHLRKDSSSGTARNL